MGAGKAAAKGIDEFLISRPFVVELIRGLGDVPSDMITASKEGVYAGGDAVTGAATVILARGAGKAAAKGIDEFLSK